MIKLIFITFITAFSISLSCDWDIINFEPESEIFYIYPLNEHELISYSYDGEGNMFYQFSSDSGNTWGIIREEESKIAEGGSQPESVRKVIVANHNTVLFFRYNANINSYNTETKEWGGINSQSKGSKVSDRHYYKDNGKIIVKRSDIDEKGNEVPYLFIADTSSPLNFERKRMFAEDFPLNTSYMQNFGIKDGEYYFWYFKPSGVYDSIGIYDIYSKELEYIKIKDTVKYIDKLYFFNDELYFTNYKFTDENMTKQANVAFYKYDRKTGNAIELHKFDHNYYGIPEMIPFNERTFSIRISDKFYMFRDDEYYKTVEFPTLDCEGCTADKVSLSYNKHNNDFYYTTKGSCLFKSSDFYNELLSTETSVEFIQTDEDISSFVIAENSFQLESDRKIKSVNLFNINGSKISASISNIGIRTTQININQNLPAGIYYLVAYFENEAKTYKLIKI